MQSVWVVDDDMMSREVAALLLSDAGFDADAFESGEEALAALEGASGIPQRTRPDAMLIDMQMPGISGDDLAVELRSACGPSTRLIVMSGTGVTEMRRKQFDAFLMKPFTAEEIQQVLGTPETARPVQQPAVPPGFDPALVHEPTFIALRQTMPKPQLRALYMMCLDDVEARLQTMERASESRDSESFRRAAHSIKGGCGMVGAIELARIADDLEHNGMPVVHNMVPFQQFLAASARLRGMLGRVLDNAD